MKKLNTKILVILMPIILIALMASSGIVYKFSNDKLEEKIMLINEKESRLLANETGQWLGKFYNMIDVTAKTDEQMLLTDQQRLNLMEKMISFDEAITDVYFAFENGLMLDGSGWEPTADYDPLARPWYIEALAEKDTVYGDPYVDKATGLVVASVSSPVLHPNGLLKGVLSADIELNAVTERINSMAIGENGFVSIMTNKGVFVAHPDENMISKNALSDVEDEEIRLLAESVTKDDEGSVTYLYNKIESVATYAAIPNTNWKIIVTVPKTSLTSELSVLKVIILLSTLIFASLTSVVVLFLTRRITKPIEELSNATKRLSDGDLTQHVNIKDNTEIGQLSSNFDEMAKNLKNLVRGITKLSSDVSHASVKMNASSGKTEEISEQISSAIYELAKGAEQQSQSVNTSVEKISIMTHDLGDIVDRIQEVYDMTEAINLLIANGEKAIEVQNESMVESSEASNSVSESMKILENKTLEIEKIVTVIDGIASQTNLLALNASIEAARAGEQGRGFAVVAEEIRKLAEQSSASTSQIDSSIAEIISSTKRAVSEAQVAGIAVKNQEVSVKEVTEIFSGVKSSVISMKTQFDNVRQKNERINDEANAIRDAIRNISDVIEMNSAGSEEVAASTEQQVTTLQSLTQLSSEVASLASQLEQEVEKFKTE
jgi:methyl-accepting chemotaxis protein